MTTSFEEIYDVFLSKINDPDFIAIDSDDEFKYRYLRNAIPKFNKCRKNLSDRTLTEFNVNLSDIEILILGNLMVIEYCEPQIHSLENLSQAISWKDFTLTSQANHLKALMDLKQAKSIETSKLIVVYTYDTAKLGELR